MVDKKLISDLEQKARIVRQDIIIMIGLAGSGHPGGSLSSADIMTVLYFYYMRHKPEDPFWPERDRFILSKGHTAPVLYSAMAEAGYFPKEEIKTLRKYKSRLQGHPHKLFLPGVEISTGSLGQGLAVANGVALAGKLDHKNYRVYVIIGDGESQEGMVWEAAMFASQHKLDNLTAFLDYNKLQIDGRIKDIIDLEPVVEKWKSFGWNTLEIDGHSITQIIEALDKAKKTKGQPTMIIAHTTKGKGVSFMENKVEFHGKAPSPEQTVQALKELGLSEEEIATWLP